MRRLGCAGASLRREDLDHNNDAGWCQAAGGVFAA